MIEIGWAKWVDTLVAFVHLIIFDGANRGGEYCFRIWGRTHLNVYTK